MTPALWLLCAEAAVLFCAWLAARLGIYDPQALPRRRRRAQRLREISGPTPARSLLLSSPR